MYVATEPISCASLYRIDLTLKDWSERPVIEAVWECSGMVVERTIGFVAPCIAPMMMPPYLDLHNAGSSSCNRCTTAATTTVEWLVDRMYVLGARGHMNPNATPATRLMRQMGR